MPTAPVDVRVAPIVSVVPLNVTPTAVIALDRLIVPEEVRDRAPVKVSVAEVVILPAEEIVKLLRLERVPAPIARAVEPLLKVTLLVAEAAVEPMMERVVTALVPVRLTVLV